MDMHMHMHMHMHVFATIAIDLTADDELAAEAEAGAGTEAEGEAGAAADSQAGSEICPFESHVRRLRVQTDLQRVALKSLAVLFYLFILSPTHVPTHSHRQQSHALLPTRGVVSGGPWQSMNRNIIRAVSRFACCSVPGALASRFCALQTRARMAAAKVEGGTYILEEVTLEEEDDDDYEYKEVEVEEEIEDEEADEALEQVLATVRTKKLEGTAFGQPQPPRPAVTQRPEVLDDFIRNALLKLGMVHTCRPPTPWPLPVVRS